MDLFFIILFFAPLFATIIFNSTIYNGWRQVYFIYPGLIYISISGLIYINKSFKKKTLIYLFLTVYSFSTLYWMIYNHPHQYVYFNNLISKDNIKDKFDLDYWGLSYKESLEKVLQNDKSEEIKISNLSSHKLDTPLRFFYNIDSKRFIQTNISEADYLITNYYLRKKNLDDNTLKKNYIIFYDVIIDGYSINRVYKKKTD